MPLIFIILFQILSYHFFRLSTGKSGAVPMPVDTKKEKKLNTEILENYVDTMIEREEVVPAYRNMPYEKTVKEKARRRPKVDNEAVIVEEGELEEEQEEKGEELEVGEEVMVEVEGEEVMLKEEKVAVEEEKQEEKGEEEEEGGAVESKRKPVLKKLKDWWNKIARKKNIDVEEEQEDKVEQEEVIVEEGELEEEKELKEEGEEEVITRRDGWGINKLFRLLGGGPTVPKFANCPNSVSKHRCSSCKIVVDPTNLSKEYLDSQRSERKLSNIRGGWKKFPGGLKGGHPLNIPPLSRGKRMLDMAHKSAVELSEPASPNHQKLRATEKVTEWMQKNPVKSLFESGPGPRRNLLREEEQVEGPLSPPQPAGWLLLLLLFL